MKKKSALRSAFFNSRVLISLAVCVVGALVALLAFALYPGGNARAEQGQQQALASVEEAQQNQPSVATPVRENVIEAQAQLISVTPVENLKDMAAEIRRMHSPPFAAQPEGVAGIVKLVGNRVSPIDANRVSPLDPNQATPTPTPLPGTFDLLDTISHADTAGGTTSTPHTYMGDGFENTLLGGERLGFESSISKCTLSLSTTRVIFSFAVALHFGIPLTMLLHRCLPGATLSRRVISVTQLLQL